jgi:hypothetical protein
MSLSKSKCWYSNNCLHFLKVRCSIFIPSVKLFLYLFSFSRELVNLLGLTLWYSFRSTTKVPFILINQSINVTFQFYSVVALSANIRLLSKGFTVANTCQRITFSGSVTTLGEILPLGLLKPILYFTSFHLNKLFHDMVCCRYFKVSKVV